MPDSFNWTPGSYPPNSFIVSRKPDGSTASVFSDDVWDLSAYEHQSNSLEIVFNGWFDGPTTNERRHIISELKWVIFIFIWFRKSPLGTRTIYARFLVLKKIAIYAEGKNIFLEQFFNEPRYILDYLQDNTAINITVLPSLLSDLIKVGPKILGYRVVGGTTLKQLRLIHSKYSQNFRQHPTIPSRIYLLLIQMFSDELDSFDLISDRVLKIVRDCIFDPLNGLTLSSQYRKANKLGIKWTIKDARKTFPHLLQQYDLEQYFKLWESKTGIRVNSTQTLLSYLLRILYTCKHTIHLYSGMRNSEVTNLPFHCIEIFKTNGKTHYRINGRTTKQHKGIPTRAVWVTSIEGINAIKIVQKIALLVYNAIGDIPKKSMKFSHKYPLFISLGYLEFSESSFPNENSNGYVTQFLSKKLIDYMPHLIPKIAETDLHELESLDPYRAWRTEDEFKLGMPWPLTPHQFRRSLAVYASNSGMVSLPSLRRQLQHLTEEMSTYYARGSNFAKNLIKNNRDHFAREYQDTQPESQALAYLSHVIFSDERLFGPHGTWVERNIRNTSPLVSSSVREDTFKRFKKGEITYRETHLGGCTEITPCNKRAIRSIIGCLDCSRAIIKLSKLDRAIAIQKSFVKKLPPHTMEWKTEYSDLESLLKFRQRMLSQENITGE
ncbi:MAG: hypothetical protein ABW076_04265 [Candidatus Thiodiazotropha sp.]